jgi:hypothetical protein
VRRQSAAAPVQFLLTRKEKGGDNMATFKDILKSAFTDTASLVHVTPKFVKVDRTPASHWDIHVGSVRASNRLTARGSVALSRLPVLSEEELLARKKRILEYDFSER